MLIKLSNNIYINPDKIVWITQRTRCEGKYEEHTVTEWVIECDAENRLTLSQAHFDELMACLPEPLKASNVSQEITDIHDLKPIDWSKIT